MSSTSMGIGGKHLTIGGKLSDPGTLNAWLLANGGYTSGNDLIESVVPHINPSHISWPSDAMHPTNDLPVSKIVEMLKDGRPVIANVMHGHHFVLVVGYDANNLDTLYINDPGFERSTYSYRYGAHTPAHALCPTMPCMLPLVALWLVQILASR